MIHAPNLTNMLADTVFGSMSLRAKLFAYIVDEKNGVDADPPRFFKLRPFLFEESGWAAVADAVPFITKIKPWCLRAVVKDLVSDVAIGDVEGFDPLGDQSHYIAAVVLGLFETVSLSWPTRDYRMTNQLDESLVTILESVSTIDTLSEYALWLPPGELTLPAADLKLYEQRLGAAIKSYVRDHRQRVGPGLPYLLDAFQLLRDKLGAEEPPHPIVRLIAEQLGYAVFGGLSTSDQLHALFTWKTTTDTQN